MKAVVLAALVCAVAAIVFGVSSARSRPSKPRHSPEFQASLAPKQPASLSQLLVLPRDQIMTCDVALMNLLCAEGLHGAENLNTDNCLTTLAQWARCVDFETQRHLYRYRKNPAEFDHSEAKLRMLMLGVVLQTNFGVRYNPERITPVGVFEPNHVFFADSRDVLLHGLVGERRMGTCSSLPVLYVAVGRRLGYPLKLVKTKSHLLARWDSPSEYFNIEATGRGVGWYDDDHFKQWPIPASEEEITAFGLLKSMTPAEELAVFLTIRGSCLQAQGRATEAIGAYEQAVQFDPASQEYRLILAVARHEFAGDAYKSSGSGSTGYQPVPSGDLPDGTHSVFAPGFSGLPPAGIPPLPRPGVSFVPARPNPFHPSLPQIRIPNPYPQGGP
ncbi:MAG: hypothetical protein HY735_06155 [Verrucomicrobia bacterium]|nr:hypothetical protein [Verrucomicrobiota bacterium]